MSRLGGLLLKELLQHGWVLALLGLFVGVTQGLLVLGSAIAPRTITMLEVHESFVRLFLPLLGLALGRRLVVREYYAHTQRFLAALPVYRWEVFVQKLGLGAALLGLAAFASLAVAALVASFKEPLDAQWLIIVLWRTEVFVLALWAFFFTMGLLGRWRVPVYLAIAMVLLYVNRATEVSLSRVPPLSLVNETFVLERARFPAGDLAWSLLFVVVTVGLGAFLALARDGGLADSLAQTMSRVEKVAVGVVLSLALIGTSVADPLADEPPFAFEARRVERRAEVGLAVLYLEDTQAASAAALADHLALDLTALRDELALHELPPVHVALRPDLDPHDYEEVALEEGDPGVLVRARYHDEAFDRSRFSQRVLELAIVKATDGRAAHEPLAWVRSAVAGRIARPGTERLAAVYAAARRPRYEDLARLWRTEERFGEGVAAALAAVAADVAVEEASEARWRAFARSCLSPEPWPGVLEAVALRRDPVEARLARELGVDHAALEAAWAARLRALRPRAPRLPAAYARIEEEEGALRTVAWGVTGATPEGAGCALVHAPLGPFDGVVDPSDEVRDERPCAAVAGEPARLIGRYGARDRVLLAIEIELDDGPVRLLAERRELP